MSKCVSWQRARNEDQIEQRTETILNAAATLLNEYRVDEITFAMIGKQANFTRSNLYRYFKSKEEIYLQLLAHDLKLWCLEAKQLIETKTVTRQNFPQRWVELLLQHTRLLTLFSLLYTLLEKNVSDDSFKQFKLGIDTDIRGMTEVLLLHKLFLSQDKTQKFLLTHTSLVSGMFGMMVMPQHQKTLMRELKLAIPEHEVQATLVEGVQALFQAFSS